MKDLGLEAIESTQWEIYQECVFYQFLRVHGKVFQGAQRPRAADCRASGKIFQSAWNLSRKRNFDYVEGYVYSKLLPQMPQLHAWCFDRVAQTPIDPTGYKPETSVYLGVVVPTDDVKWSRREPGILVKDGFFEPDVAFRHWGWRTEACRLRCYGSWQGPLGD